MEENYQRGFRVFELDFEFTSDRRLVLTHDWSTFESLAFVVGVPTYAEFVSALMKVEITPTTLDLLLEFLNKHRDAYVITDFKSDETDGLTYIAINFPALQKRILPYIFSFRHYEVVRRLGYRNMILALYTARTADEETVQFAKEHELFAVAIPADRALQSDLVEDLSKAGVRVCVHTSNSWREIRMLRRRGASCFIVDYLNPAVVSNVFPGELQRKPTP